MEIVYATKKDSSYLLRLDSHITSEELTHSISKKRVYVIKENHINIGFLRFNLFWDNTPFMNLLFIEEGYRNLGYGTSLLSFFESEMKKAGYSLILTSTLEKEMAKIFYTRLGFSKIGQFMLPDEDVELLFCKKLEQESL